MEKPISVDLYGDGSRKSRLRAEYIYCEHAEECSAYKSGKCFNVTVPFGKWCKTGRVHCIDGGTKNSKAYDRVWTAAKGSEVYHHLKYPFYEYIVKVGDSALLSLRYCDIKVEGEQIFTESPGFGAGLHFVSNDLLTPENIHRIVTAKPRSMMGDVINKYQTDIVPNFLYQFKQLYPEQYEAYAKEHPESESVLPNWVGRCAKLITCNRDMEYLDCHKNKWHFDGDDLVCEHHGGFNPFTNKPVSMRVALTDDMEVIITDNEQVLPDTVLL